MTDQDLDRCYTAVCEALGAVGEQQSPLCLSMLCLALMARFDAADAVLPLIATAQAQCANTGGA
jgi:hypothetical protein